MQLVLPLPVEQFRQTYVKLFNHGYFYGGCVRDFIFNHSVNDFDFITQVKLKYVKTKFEQSGIKYYTKPNHVFIYVDCGGYELQIGECETVVTDFTINGLRADVKTLEIYGPKIYFDDIKEKILRNIDTHKRIYKRGLYMLYKYDLTIEPKTLKTMRKFDYDVTEFMQKKQVDLDKIYYLKNKIHEG